jgi:LAO/AO transport system kinase
MPDSSKIETAADPVMVKAVLSGDFRAVARLISWVEDGVPDADHYLRELFHHTGRSFIVGITGAAGSGKSTLADCLSLYYRADERKLGIVAVDPTSPYTGGAVLGDRIRMQSRSLDPGTFVRSMATRGHLGGLARATSDVLLVLDAAGFDTVLVETVGVGQDEVDIVRTAHVTVVLLVPGMGDDVQAMKAGIMEIGDIFVINKADHPGVERIEAELHSHLQFSRRKDGWQPRVVKTVASEGRGIEECFQEIESCREFLRSSGAYAARAAAIQRERLLEMARSRVLGAILGDERHVDKLDELARRVAAREIDPYSAAEDLLREAGIHVPRTGVTIVPKD